MRGHPWPLRHAAEMSEVSSFQGELTDNLQIVS